MQDKFSGVLSNFKTPTHRILFGIYGFIVVLDGLDEMPRLYF